MIKAVLIIFACFSLVLCYACVKVGSDDDDRSGRG